MELAINIGDEYKIKIEKGSTFNNSIFKKVYQNAANCIVEIIDQSENEKGVSISNDSNNNIVAFTGERGTGKSSSMISFAEALIQKENLCHKYFFKDEKYNLINQNKIISLNVIDPSLFKGGDNLFEIIISKMFSKFQDKIDSKTEELNHDQKRELIKRFQDVFNNLKVVHNGKKEVYDKEAIEALSDLAYGTNLKNSFFKLVDSYIKFIGDNSKFLLIVIDDFDLNISGAYDMLEDIRQFLIQKNIILFIACKIEQLQDSVEQKIREEFNIMLGGKANYLSDNPNEMSSRYLFKLIPVNRRCYLPILSYNDSSLELKYKDELIKIDSIEKSILDSIYRTTGFLFLVKRENVNFLIPKNLREFIHFYKFIKSIELIEGDNKKKEAQSNFKEYFLNVWSYNNLSKEQNQIIKELNENDSGNKNKSLIINLKRYFSELDADHNVIKHIEKIENNSLNISIGDVLYVLSFYSKITSSTEESKFIFAIKTYYTIELTRLFDSQIVDAETIIGANINSEDIGIIVNPDINDFWSFEWKNISELNNNDGNAIINNLIVTFITSKKQSIKRDSNDIIYKLNTPRANTDVVFSLLGFIRNSFFEENQSKPYLIPAFSIDLMEELFSRLLDGPKFKYSNNYSALIFKHILPTISKVLGKIDKDLEDKFKNDSFIVSLIKNEKEFTEKLNYLKTYSHNIIKEEVTKKVNTLKKDSGYNFEDIKGIAENRLRYYGDKYFNNDNYTPQGVKQAMNFLVKDFSNYPKLEEELDIYRRLMNRDLDKGLFGIQYYLETIIKNG